VTDVRIQTAGRSQLAIPTVARSTFDTASPMHDGGADALPRDVSLIAFEL
jgi:hypothetical protein